MIRIAICDDDPATTGSLERMIMSLQSLYESKFEISLFFSGEEFCAHISKANEPFNIILMDIELGTITGIEAGRLLRENIANDQTLLIFVSNHKTYYKEIIDLSVFCFIPKPIRTDEFNEKLGRAIKSVLNKRQFLATPVFLIKKNQHTASIPLDSILYLVSDLRKVYLHTETEVHDYYGKLDEEELKLPPDTFCRIHKSYLINFIHMKILTHRNVVMMNDKRLTISEPYRERVRGAYHHYREGKSPYD